MPGTALTSRSLPEGAPKPEPEQVIRKYTEELKVAPEEVCVLGGDSGPQGLPGADTGSSLSWLGGHR